MLGEIENLLRPMGTRERAEGEKKYLKSDLEFFGVKVPDVRKASKAWLRGRKDLDRALLLSIVEALWARPVHELRTFGVELLKGKAQLLEEDDLSLVEALLRQANTWAHVDPLAIEVAGDLAERFPRLGGELDRWSRDPLFWLRRSSLLALLRPLRRGEGDWSRFVVYADGMLEEKEFFIRKAIGWVLRETGKKRPERVVEFLASRWDRASGLTRREATRNLPPEVRRELPGMNARARS